MLANSLLLDAGGPLLFLLVGAPIALITIAAIVVLEAVLLRALKWDASFQRCLLHALAINAVSSLIGCGLVFAVQAASQHSPIGQSPVWTFGPLLVAFVLTVIVEALLLRALKRDGPQPWRMSLIINVASYIVLVVVALVVFNL